MRAECMYVRGAPPTQHTTARQSWGEEECEDDRNIPEISDLLASCYTHVRDQILIADWVNKYKLSRVILVWNNHLAADAVAL